MLLPRGITMAFRLCERRAFEQLFHLRLPHQRILRLSTSRWMSSNSSESHPEERMMNFEEYRKLKRSLKWNARVAGIPMGCIAVGISSLANLHFMPHVFDTSLPPEEITPILGMDPIVFAAVCGAASGMVGFILGGAFFNAVWKMVSSKAKQIEKRDADFLSRLQRHRYVGTDQNKYEDDYYADKVLTLSDYRQWIRQQQRKKEAAASLNSSNKETDSGSDKQST